jgi:hypothetical protein
MPGDQGGGGSVLTRHAATVAAFKGEPVVPGGRAAETLDSHVPVESRPARLPTSVVRCDAKGGYTTGKTST